MDEMIDAAPFLAVALNQQGAQHELGAHRPQPVLELQQGGDDAVLRLGIEDAQRVDLLGGQRLGERQRTVHLAQVELQGALGRQARRDLQGAARQESWPWRRSPTTRPHRRSCRPASATIRWTTQARLPAKPSAPGRSRPSPATAPAAPSHPRVHGFQLPRSSPFHAAPAWWRFQPPPLAPELSCHFGLTRRYWVAGTVAGPLAARTPARRRGSAEDSEKRCGTQTTDGLAGTAQLHGLRQQLQHLQRIVPAQAGVGDALPVFQPRWDRPGRA